MNIAVVYNPAGAETEAAHLRELLAEHGIDASWHETTEEDPGVGQTKRATESGADLVLACGGDGTVRACAEALAGTGTALGVIPAGTGNLLARNFAIPTDVPGALAVALSGARRTIDVGTVNGEVFTVMAGAGLDAEVMANTSRTAKNAVGSLAYVATAGRVIATAEPVPGRVRVDGRTVHDGPVTTVLVGNCGKLQAGIDLMPAADPSDGALDVLVLSAGGFEDWVKAAAAALTGDQETATLERAQGLDVAVELDRPLRYELDGEARPSTTRLEIGVRPRALTICVPKEAS